MFSADLEINTLNIKHGNGLKALNAVSLTIEPGMLGLLGSNGAGKSTHVRSLATLQSISSRWPNKPRCLVTAIKRGQ